MRLIRWLRTSNVVLVVGILVAAAILTIMYFRITRDPSQVGTPTASQPSSSLVLPADGLPAMLPGDGYAEPS